MLQTKDKKSRFARRVGALFESVRRQYMRLLSATLRVRFAVYIAWIVLSLLAVALFMVSPKELAPTEDQGIIFSIVDSSPNASLDDSLLYTAAINDAFMSVEETDFTFQIAFPSGGFGGMIVEPWEDRERTIFEILPEVAMQMTQVPGLSVFPVTPPALPGGGQFPVEFVIASTDDTETILGFAQQLQLKALQSGLFAFPPIIDTKIDQPEARLVIDRDRVADMGLNLQQIGADVGVLLGGGYVNRFNIDGRSYRVIPQVKRSERLSPDQLQDLYVSGPEGQLIQLGSVASIEKRTVPRALNRFQQLNAVKLSGVAPQSLDGGLAFLEKEAAAILPDGYSIDYTGESRQLRREGNKFIPAFSLSLLLIFMVLAAQFNSFRDPLVILAGSVPLALFGALIFTGLKQPNPNVPFWTDSFTTTLNIYSQVGLVTLIGLVAKNGILVVEFAKQLQLRGLTKLAAIRESSSTRLRPILMTTFATVAGHFPLTLVTGAGAEARNSIGLVLVGGMAIGTLFTLFVIPSLYMLIARDLGGTRQSIIDDPENTGSGQPSVKPRIRQRKRKGLINQPPVRA